MAPSVILPVLFLLFGTSLANTTDAHVLEVLDGDLQREYFDLELATSSLDRSVNTFDSQNEIINSTDSDYLIISHANETFTEVNDTIAAEEYLHDLKEFLFPKTWTWVLISLHFVVFTVGLVGNILVCVAVYRNHSMRTVTNYFIVNLAIADFMVIVFCLIPSVIWDVTLTWFFGVIMCKVVLYLQTVSVTVSVLTLTFISVDRWYAICFPLKFKSTTGRAKTAIGIIWMIALTFDIPELLVYTTMSHDHGVKIDTIYLTQCGPTWSLDTDTFWTVLKLFLLYVVPLAFMTVTYYQITKVLWKSGNVSYTAGDGGGGGASGGSGRPSQFSMNTNIEIQLRSRIKAAKMLVAVVLMFAFCYFPVHLLSVLRLTVGLKNSDFNRAFALISHWLCYANSAVNPVIYNFMSGKFRKEFKRAIDCCSQPYHPSGRHEMTSFFYKNTLRETMTTPTAGARSTRRIVDRPSTNNIDTTEFNAARRGTSTTVIKIDV